MTRPPPPGAAGPIPTSMTPPPPVRPPTLTITSISSPPSPGTVPGGSGNYAISFGSGAVINLPAGTSPVSFDVTNTTYDYLSMTHGDGFGTKFTTGKLELKIFGYTGLGGSGAEVGEVDFDLARYTSPNPCWSTSGPWWTSPRSPGRKASPSPTPHPTSPLRHQHAGIFRDGRSDPRRRGAGASTWAMLLIGLAGLAFVGWRARRDEAIGA